MNQWPQEPTFHVLQNSFRQSGIHGEPNGASRRLPVQPAHACNVPQVGNPWSPLRGQPESAERRRDVEADKGIIWVYEEGGQFLSERTKTWGAQVVDQRASAIGEVNGLDLLVGVTGGFLVNDPAEGNSDDFFVFYSVEDWAEIGDPLRNFFRIFGDEGGVEADADEVVQRVGPRRRSPPFLLARNKASRVCFLKGFLIHERGGER